MNWSALTPEQRNALVAEHIGWQAAPCEGTSLDLLEMPGEWRCAICGYQARYDAPLTHNDAPLTHTTATPRYSEDMNAAWDALKHAAGGYPAHLADRAVLIAELFQRPLAAGEGVNIYFMLGVMCAFTPELICRAILKAYGVEIEE
jgi:hypothetical protein